jgi:DNA-binding CsgD family transcriptional regulator/tetratricopeptide (TPR) repeat protein
MKRIVAIGLLIFVAVAACTRQQTDFLSPTDVQDAEYALLIDSVEDMLDSFKYHDFTDSVVSSALAFYNMGNTSRDYWMQARCHYLTGCLSFEKKTVSQEAATHFLETLHILDDHFDPTQPNVGQLYSKTYRVMSRIAFNFSDERCSTRLARIGLDCATVVDDTIWMALSCANLGLLYERYGKAGEGDTAYYYCHEGMRLVNDERFPFETAMLCNALANCHRHSREYDTALYFFGYVKSLVDSTFRLYHKNYIEEAFVYYRMKDYTSAISDLEVAFRSKDEGCKMQAAFGLSDCYEGIGDTLKAAPYSSIVKKQREKEILNYNHNAEVMPMFNDYLKSRQTSEKQNESLYWSLCIAVLVVLAFAFYHRWHKMQKQQQDAETERKLKQHQREAELKLQEARSALKYKEIETLQVKARVIYDDKRNNTYKRIMDLFNAAYPEALDKLKAAYPELNDTELAVMVLAFFSFIVKETASIMDLRENTVSKYRSSIRKKTGADDFESLIFPCLG